MILPTLYSDDITISIVVLVFLNAYVPVGNIFTLTITKFKTIRTEITN